MITRREAAADETATRAVHVAAFARVGAGVEPIEAHLLDRLRGCDGWIPELSIVACIDDVVVGHVVTTRGRVGRHTALGLGPIGVLPDHQGAGVGHALMHTTIGAAEALGEPFIALLGDPGFYRRFGFVPSTTRGIAPPDGSWGAHFQIRTLTDFDPTVRGRFAYAAPFDELD